ncbi:hypothetical protein DXU92_00735 [Brachybacterium saurashtrense]|uniref:DUF559 domain-containing protein n=1 Tax=Brachybacterium saurashtrense TaxID=556288 RepID=A0A345YP77_9MICO|nr:hypothetical protein DWV08_08990 [Brachybacterium saurashtrense]RRR24747.1 hypothetical protein DXU92_00735 [Brachybacterium saurashtrense]
MGQWYVTDDAPQDLVDLLALGVRPTCLDSASLHGLWVPPGDGVHAFRPRVIDAPSPVPHLRPIRRRRVPGTDELIPLFDAGARRGGSSPEPLVLHAPRLRSWGSTDPVPDLLQTLHHAARCLPTVKAAILIESALESGRLSDGDLGTFLAGLPQRYRRPLMRVRCDAQSGTETAVRWWLEERCVKVRSQVQLLPGIRVDLLLGSNWVIECDSRTFHDDPRQYQKDRQRDLVLSARGYRVTRLTWEQVFLHWGRTARMLQTMLRRREHVRALPA